MLKGNERMIEKHARATPSHNFSYPFAMLRGIAMNGAFAAGGFCIAEFATRKSAMCIAEKFFIFGWDRL